MKIAFCFCGAIRTGVYASPNIINFIGELFPNTDFFIHTWNKNLLKDRSKESFKGRYSPFKTHNINNSVYDVDKCFNNKIISSEIENFDIWNERFGKHYNFSPQWYSWYKVNNLKKQYENINNFKYDIVIKTRLDCIIHPNSNLTTEIEHVSRNLNTFYSQGVTEHRINDVFFIASSTVMDMASNFIVDTSCRDWYNDVFGDYLKSKNITVKNTHLNTYAIYRPESIPTDPVNNFKQCFNDDHDWYSVMKNNIREQMI